MEFLKLSRAKFIFLFIMCIFISGCSIFKPFVDRRRNAGASDIEKLYVGKSTPNAPAICYNSLWTEYQELQTMADTECQKNNTGTKAVFDKETSFTCRLFLPSHIYFKCEK